MSKRIIILLTLVSMLLTILPLPVLGAGVTSLAGDGSASAPYEIGTADELVFAAQRMNASDSNYTGKQYILTADLDLSSIASFPMILSFSGTLNGDGHVIRNLTVTDTVGTVPSSGYGIGFIHKNSGTIMDLTFDGAKISTVANASGNGNSGAAVVAAENCQNGLITRVTVKNSEVNAPKVPKAAGIASMNSRSASKGTNICTIDSCVVKDTLLIGGPRLDGNAYGLMMGGIAGYSGTSTISDCYVSNVTIQAASETTSPFYAGMICGYGAGGVINGNVVASGTLQRLAAEADQKFTTVRTGGICAISNSYYGYLVYDRGNLLDRSNVIGATTTFALSGTATTAEALALQSTYEGLGWDFYSVWKMENGAPVLRTPSERMDLKLEGSGTEEDPFRIGSAEDLLYAVQALNLPDQRVVGKVLALTADIDLTGVNFTPIDSFSGILDGRNHTIKNLTINDATTGTQNAEYRLAFIRTNSGTVKNLVFDSPTVTTQALSTGGYSGAAVVVGENANGSLVSHCVVRNAVVDAPNLPKAAGIAVMNGRTNGHNGTISCCVFEGTIVCGPRASAYGPQMGGIAAYSATSTIEYCLVNADITHKMNDSIQSTVAHAALICGYPNGVTFRSNVAYGGSITIEGEVATQNVGRIYGYTYYNQEPTNNLAYENITINGEIITDTHIKQGASVSADALIKQETYEQIGWDFDLQWVMNDGTAYPDRYPLPGTFTYPEGQIDRLTAVITGNQGRSIGFTWYYAEGKDMNLLLSTNSDLSDAMTIPATWDGTCYRAEAADLDSNLRYYYQVEGDGQQSEIGTFTTAGSREAFTFLSVSDTEADSLEEAIIAADTLSAASMMAPNAAFLLHSGDFVSSSRGEEGWKELLYFADPTLRKLPLVPTMGEEDGEGFLKHFNLSSPYYSFDYGTAHFVILNSTEDAAQCLSAEQLTWLKKDIAKTAQEWVILSLHKGPYTSGTHANDTEIKALRELFINELDGLGIDLVIQGHDHIMGHTYDLKDDDLTAQPVFTELLNGKRFDYTMDPEGVTYMMSGSAGAQFGTQMDTGDLDEYILKFARSDGRGEVQTFSAITVEDKRIKVESYEIISNNEPTMIEGFGIDKEVSYVERLIDSGDASAARKAYNALSSEQKHQVENYPLLISAEGGAVAENGGAWLDAAATQRRSILIRNDTDLDFTHAPVLVKLENAPSETMAFFTTEGELLPYEIESFDAAGITTVWVKVPLLPAQSAAGLWVYFGGADHSYEGKEVWGDSYALVEHFESVEAAADSTGKQNGQISGELQSVALAGDKGAAFDGSDRITYGNIGDDYSHLSISAVVSVEEGDLASMNEGAGIVSKYVPGDPTGKNAYLLGINGEGKLHSYYGCMWWRSLYPRRKSYVTEALADGKPHMITVAYDGFTIQTFVDGKTAAWESVFIESTAFLNLQTMTTIGSYSASPLNGQVSGGFKGHIYDVQINGKRTTTQWEAFRYSNYFGDAVTVGQPEEKDSFALTVDRATRGTAAEASKLTVSGILSEDATLTAEVNGRTVELGSVKAGKFTVSIPVIGTGDQAVVITAVAGQKTVSAELTLSVVDTVAPKEPTLSAEGNRLMAQTVAEDGDQLTADFRIHAAIPLTESNTKLAQGSTEAKTPAAVDPAQAVYSPLSVVTTTTTVEDGTNPYQIYAITLTDEEAALNAWRFFWQGESSRQIHAYGYDFRNSQWVKLCSTEGSGELSLNIELEGSQYVQDNVLYLMFFRGMGQETEELTSFIPEDGQYDFTMFWNSDTQYMSQFYEELKYHQYQWIADTFADKKGVLTFNTGDLANRSNLNYEYNWKVVDKAYEIFEEAGIPYTFCWGNHDLDFDKRPNETRYYQSYFPTSRLSENTGAWEISCAPDSITGTTTRAMYLKQTIQGAKLMILSLAYESRLTESDLQWAETVVQEHSDYTIILITHTYSSDTAILDTDIRTRIVEPYANVKLVLNGHLDGVSTFKMSNGGFAVLQDYQGEYGEIKYGGNEFMRLIQFDVENDLIYFNTYSPLTGETLSPYGAASDPAAEGLYQKNGDEFALAIELNGNQSRSFTTKTLSLSAAQPVQSQGVTVTEGEAAGITVEGLEPGQEYLWHTILTDSSGNSTVSATASFSAVATEPKPDNSLKIYHSLNLASDISVNYVVLPSQLQGYDMDTVYLEVRIQQYKGNTPTTEKALQLKPVLRDGYYYFTLNGMSAVQINDRMTAVLYGTKNGQTYCSAEDDYSIADYAYSQMNKASVPESLKILCADLLRYGAAAQIYKVYRTDALADTAMTETQKAYLSELDNVTFDNISYTEEEPAEPVILWGGKTLDLASRVMVRFVINASNYSGNVADLTLKVSYVNIYGETMSFTLTNPTVYSGISNYYAFDFDGLLAAELRQPISAAVYEGDTRLSSVLYYSASSYGNNKTGTLLTLCKALMAYSDSAKAYFLK